MSYVKSGALGPMVARPEVFAERPTTTSLLRITMHNTPLASFANRSLAAEVFINVCRLKQPSFVVIADDTSKWVAG